MMLFVVIFMLMPGLNYGFLIPGDTICKVIGDTTCTVTLGRNIFIQVMTNTTGFRIQFSKGSKEMFDIKSGTLRVLEDAFRDRTEPFMHNGTIKIQNVQWEHAGQYKVEIHKSGVNVMTAQVTLEVKANPWPIVVFTGASVGAFLVVVLITCCICRKVKTRKRKAGACNY